MKPTPENIDTVLNASYYQGKEAELYGQEIELPADIPAYFDAVEGKTAGLPAEFADFESGLNRHAGAGRHAYKNGDEVELRKRIWIISQNLQRLKRNLADYGRQQGVINGGNSTAERKREEQQERIADTVRRWEKLAKDGRPERERAGIIAQQTGHPVDTVRRWVRKAGLR